MLRLADRMALVAFDHPTLGRPEIREPEMALEHGARVGEGRHGMPHAGAGACGGRHTNRANAGGFPTPSVRAGALGQPVKAWPTDWSRVSGAKGPDLKLFRARQRRHATNGAE